MMLRNLLTSSLAALAVSLAIGAGLRAAAPEDVLKNIDPKTGVASDTSTSYGVSGIVSARATLADGRVLAFLHSPGAAGLPVLAPAAESANLIPRFEVTLSGKLGDGPFGAAALIVTSPVTVSATNKSVGTAELRGPDFFKDPSALAGRYVSLTNVTFGGAAFDGSGRAVVKAETGEVPLLISATLKGKMPPEGAFNVFGVPLRVGAEWRLLACRFISVNNKAAQAVASKRTCFTCHNPDMKVVGPAYRDVAARYKDDPEAPGKLMAQIEKGGAGKWGPVPMPALGALVPPEERKQLVDWIYGYRWDALLAQ